MDRKRIAALPYKKALVAMFEASRKSCSERFGRPANIELQ